MSTWLSTYAGKVSVPHWSADYFRWQLGLDRPESRDLLTCVYDRDRLVGCVLCFPMTFAWAGEQIEAAQASWLSVHPDYRGHGVGKMVNEASGKALRERGLAFKLGYGYFGSKDSLGPKFWKKTLGESSEFVGKIGFWARVLDPARAAAWNLNRMESRLTAFSAPVLTSPRLRHPRGVCIRPVVAADLPRCLELAERSTSHADLRLLWDEESLGRQLGLQGYAEGLVAEEEGEVQGCIGFHAVPIQGNTVQPVGILDLVFVSELSARARNELVNSALLRLKEVGAVVALKLRGGDYPWNTFLNWGWVWKPVDSHVIVTWADNVQRRSAVRSSHLLWR
ncbi:MAG: GNAT family N-acetyltransferase [Planctomycetaceae bacterium]|nr:GNAT family N-acetyltransferase [Planctomycetaceae bacterium]